MGLDDANTVPVEPSPEAERPDLSWLGQGPEPSVPWVTYAQVQREKDQLARKFDALQATIPEAQATKVIQLLQLKMNMAKLQYENAHLARREKVTHEENVRLGATLAAQSTGGGPAQHPQAGAPAPGGQAPGGGRTAPGAQRSELDWIEQSETIERLRAEKSHLARRMADLIAVVPTAISARVKRIQQLKERAAQLRCNYDRLAQETEQLRREKKAWAATVQENAALCALLGAEGMNPQGELRG